MEIKKVIWSNILVIRRVIKQTGHMRRVIKQINILGNNSWGEEVQKVIRVKSCIISLAKL